MGDPDPRCPADVSLHLAADPGIYAIVQAADILKVVIGYILIQKGVWISNLVEEMQ